MKRVFPLACLCLFLVACSDSNSGWVAALGPQADTPSVERGVIDHRIDYIKKFESRGDYLSTMQYYGEMLLLICKRAEQRGLSDYLADRLCQESGNANLTNVLIHLERGNYPSMRSEVYKLYKKLCQCPGYKGKLSDPMLAI